MERHFTVTGFVSHEGRTALHWHRLGLWLPPGGHIEENEDPIEAVLREVLEETGLEVDVIPTGSTFAHAHPPQLPPPVTIGLYDIPNDPRTGGPAQHIDLVYFTRPRDASRLELPANDEGWVWVDELTLRSGESRVHPGGQHAAIPEDVRGLALAAIAAARSASAAGRGR